MSVRLQFGWLLALGISAGVAMPCVAQNPRANWAQNHQDDKPSRQQRQEQRSQPRQNQRQERRQQQQDARRAQMERRESPAESERGIRPAAELQREPSPECGSAA